MYFRKITGSTFLMNISSEKVRFCHKKFLKKSLQFCTNGHKQNEYVYINSISKNKRNGESDYF